MITQFFAVVYPVHVPAVIGQISYVYVSRLVDVSSAIRWQEVTLIAFMWYGIKWKNNQPDDT